MLGVLDPQLAGDEYGQKRIAQCGECAGRVGGLQDTQKEWCGSLLERFQQSGWR